MDPEPKKQTIEVSKIRVQFTQNVLKNNQGNYVRRFYCQDSGKRSFKVTSQPLQTAQLQFHHFLSEQRRDTSQWLFTLRENIHRIVIAKHYLYHLDD